MEKANSGNVKALDKAMLVLDFIRESPSPVGVNEIARQCSLNITTTFRILQTLKDGQWVYQDKNEKYIIGTKLSFMTINNNFHAALQEVAYYTMQAMTAKTSHAMNLAVRNYNQCLILQQSRTNKIVDYVPPIGTSLPIYASAVGKVLMAWLPRHLQDMIMDSLVFTPLTRHTITTHAALAEELEAQKAAFGETMSGQIFGAVEGEILAIAKDLEEQVKTRSLAFGILNCLFYL